MKSVNELLDAVERLLEMVRRIPITHTNGARQQADHVYQLLHAAKAELSVSESNLAVLRHHDRNLVNAVRELCVEAFAMEHTMRMEELKDCEGRLFEKQKIVMDLLEVGDAKKD